MTHLRSDVTSRTLTVVLPESDWQALRAVEPDAVAWLHERIRERLDAAAPDQNRRAAHAAPDAPDAWNQDQY
jgi:hypothetical protein